MTGVPKYSSQAIHHIEQNRQADSLLRLSMCNVSRLLFLFCFSSTLAMPANTADGIHHFGIHLIGGVIAHEFLGLPMHICETCKPLCTQVHFLTMHLHPFCGYFASLPSFDFAINLI